MPATSIAAGDLKDRVSLQKNDAVGVNPSGQPAQPQWVTYAERWAKVEPLSGKELWNAQQAGADVSVRVTMRPDGLVGPTAEVELDSKHRLLFGTRMLNIVYIRNVEERGERLEVYCTEPR